MTRSASDSPHGSEFETFLFAPIGDDRNGMLLSVLSGLARSDIDPWQEAAKLALMPVETATRRLESFIAALPDGPNGRRDAGSIAARLIALLPHPNRSNIPLRETLGGNGKKAGSWAVIYMVSYVIVMALIMGTQYIASGHQQPAQVQNAPAHATSIVSSPTQLVIPDP
jgi:hypothetical protein